MGKKSQDVSQAVAAVASEIEAFQESFNRLRHTREAGTNSRPANDDLGLARKKTAENRNSRLQTVPDGSGKSPALKLRKPEEPRKRPTSAPPQLKRTPQPAPTWSKPTEAFNIRIPRELGELLDDLVYERTKQKLPSKKQELGIEALRDLLRKHAILK